MGSTPRPHRFAIPMASRSTDLADLGKCPGSWVLKLFHEADKAEASYFILGSQLHETIECSIVFDLDLDGALRHLNAGLDRELERVDASPNRRIESSKRGFDTIRDDATRMLGNWFRSVHPDSPKRHPIYDDYEWPPQTEVDFFAHAVDTRTKYPVWGSIDAMWVDKKSHQIAAKTDWKSGASRQRDSYQLDYYEYGLRHSDWYLPPEGLLSWYHHLDKVRNNAIIQTADPYPGDDAVRQRILAAEAIKDSIVAGEYPRFNPDWYCNYCPVQEFCPVDGDARNRDKNAADLRSMLRLVKPLTTIERVA